MLNTLALSHVPVPVMKRVLHLSTGLFYNGALLYWYCKKVRDDQLGSESTSIKNFFDLGDHIKQTGGKFIVEYCNTSTRINSVFVQFKLEIELSLIYGKRLFFLDGTHNTTKCVLKAIPPQSIDCCGFTCPLGHFVVLCVPSRKNKRFP